MANYFVDAGGGSNTTGNGSAALPWATVQHALNTITRDATNGDQINVKAGTPLVLSAPLSLAAYGTPAINTPLVIRGYTAAADDGGIGVIDGAGLYSIYRADTNSNKGHVHFWDMHLRNSGAAILLQLRNYSTCVNVELSHSTADKAVNVLNHRNSFIRCRFHDLNPASWNNNSIVVGGESNAFIGCTFVAGTQGSMLYISDWAIVVHCLFIDNGNGINALAETRNDGPAVVWGNTFWLNAGASYRTALYANASSVITGDNLFQSDGTFDYSTYAYNFSQGNKCPGIVISGSNAQHGPLDERLWSRRRYTLAAPTAVLGDAPLIDPAGGNFGVAANTAVVSGGGYPATWPGVADTESFRDIGAVQAEGGGGGTTIVNPAPVIVSEGVTVAVAEDAIIAVVED